MIICFHHLRQSNYIHSLFIGAFHVQRLCIRTILLWAFQLHFVLRYGRLVIRIQIDLYFWTFAAFEKGCTIYLILFILLSSASAYMYVLKNGSTRKCVRVCLSVCFLGFYGAFGCHDESYSHGDRLRGEQYKQGNDVTRAALKPNSHGKQKTMTPSSLSLFPNASIHLLPLLSVIPFSLFSVSVFILCREACVIHRAQWLSEVS